MFRQLAMTLHDEVLSRAVKGKFEYETKQGARGGRLSLQT